MIDIDDTCGPAHGHQQLLLFHAHYDTRCFLPVHVDHVESGKLVASPAPGKTPSGVEVRTLLKHLTRRIRRHSSRTRLTYRGDSHYGRIEAIIDEPETDPAQGFRDRIASLRNDRDQLYRIWSGPHFFEFPYDLGDVDAIRETFEDILRTARRRKRKNRSMNADLEAEMSKSLEPLEDLFVADR